MKNPKVHTIERGWPGHYVCSERCMFRRNTLLICGEKRLQVSTVGRMSGKFKELDGVGSLYETRAFLIKKNGFVDYDTEITINSKNILCVLDDEGANNMHDRAVKEFKKRIVKEDF